MNIQKKSRTKANKLPTATQIRVAEKYIESQSDGSKLSAKDVANLFTDGNTRVTFNQVNSYVRKYKAGASNKARRSRTASNIAKDAEKIIADNPDTDEMIADAIKNLIAKIKADPKMESSLQADILSDIMMLREKQQRISLERHVKSLDASFLHALCRHFEPNCSEQRAIEIVVAVRSSMRKNV
jgi:hypothetical protein